MRFALGLDCGWVLGKVWLKSEGLERSALFLEGLVLGKVVPQFQDCVFLEIPLFLGVSQFQEFSDFFFLFWVRCPPGACVPSILRLQLQANWQALATAPTRGSQGIACRSGPSCSCPQGISSP